MKTILFGTALMILVVTGAVRAADNAPIPSPGMDPSCIGHEDNWRRYQEELDLIVNQNRLDLVDEFFASEYRNHNAPPWAAQGPDAIREYKGILLEAFPDRKVANEWVLCAGDFVIVRSVVTGTHTGPYFGRPATGKSFRVIGTDVYLIRDGKFYGRWGNEDALGMFQQLGWVPSGGPPED